MTVAAWIVTNGRRSSSREPVRGYDRDGCDANDGRFQALFSFDAPRKPDGFTGRAGMCWASSGGTPDGAGAQSCCLRFNC